MKNKFLMVTLLFVSLLMILPVKAVAGTYYDGYETMNLKETLESEGMTLENTKYTENDDQVPIYLFRGNGCGYCRAFLTFLNSISVEYGKYFKLVSFEVWYDEKNAALMKEVADFTGEAAGGVPYIIIGDKVFPGYISDWNDEIKAKILSQYEDNDYDVFNEMKKANGFKLDTNIIINFIFVTIAAVVVIAFNYCNTNKVLKAVDEIKYSKKPQEVKEYKKPVEVKTSKKSKKSKK